MKLLPVLAGLLLAGTAFGQNTPLMATRADLAAAYLDFEQLWRTSPPPVDELAEYNRRFDRASIAFFAGQLGPAIREINDLSLSLLPEERRCDARRAASSLKVRITPPVLSRCGDETVAIHANVESLYTLGFASEESPRLVLRLRDSRDALICEAPLPSPLRSWVRFSQRIELPVSASHLSPGAYRVELASGAVVLPRSRWFVVDRPMEEVRRKNAARLAELASTHSENHPLRSAIATCAARNELLVDEPSEDRSAEYLSDPTALQAAVAAEIAAIEAGRDPYANRPGDTWRTLHRTGPGARAVPLRIFAPPDLVERRRPVPVLFAFHGAGGDEQMFMAAYGAGRLRELAADRGFLLVTPEAYAFARDADLFPSLLSALRESYEVDPDRVYVLGHSMGAGASARIAAQHAERVAAAVCMAGGGGWARGPRFAPTRVILGALDPIVPPGRIERDARRASEAGRPVRVELRSDYGHTLLVGDSLPEAVDWLLSQRRSPASQPASAPQR